MREDLGLAVALVAWRDGISSCNLPMLDDGLGLCVVRWITVMEDAEEGEEGKTEEEEEEEMEGEGEGGG